MSKAQAVVSLSFIWSLLTEIWSSCNWKKKNFLKKPKKNKNVDIKENGGLSQ